MIMILSYQLHHVEVSDDCFAHYDDSALTVSIELGKDPNLPKATQPDILVCEEEMMRNHKELMNKVREDNQAERSQLIKTDEG